MSDMRGAPRMYRVLRRLLPPLANPYFPLTVEGLEQIPSRGGAVLACNHLSFVDSIVLPLHVPRPVYFLGKADYWHSWRTRWFFQATGVVPVDRNGGDRGAGSLRTGVNILARGDILGIYPEGTRSPDGRLYRGKTGPARMAMEAGVPIIPCGVLGSAEAMPEGRRFPRRKPVTVRYGTPIDLTAFATMTDRAQALREATNEVMAAIQSLTDQPYVDVYAADVKRGELGPADQLLSVPVARHGRARVDSDDRTSRGFEVDGN